MQEKIDRVGLVPVGSSVITTAGRLPCTVVIHTVKPRMGEGNEDVRLQRVVMGALALAKRKFPL